MEPYGHTTEPPVDPPAALRILDDVVAPDRLRLAVAETASRADHAQTRRRRRSWVAGGFATAVVVPALVVMVLAIAADHVVTDGGTTAPPVREVAGVALLPAAAPAPDARPGGTELTAHAGPIAFPTWRRVGFRVLGTRRDTIDGHELRTVFYRDRAGRRIGYAIADAALPVSGGRLTMRHGIAVRVLEHGATTVVTWRRSGRTCILAAHGVPASALARLAGYTA